MALYISLLISLQCSFFPHLMVSSDSEPLFPNHTHTHTHKHTHTHTLEMNYCKILQPQRVFLRESSKGGESSLQSQLCGEWGLEEQNSRGSLEERKASRVLRACQKEMKGNLWLRAVNVIQNTLCPPYLHPVAIEKHTKRFSFCWPKNMA